jgi:hypothetical protein
MTKANRLGMYADIRSVLDAALAAGGGTFRCDSRGAAVHWRQRAYRFRKLYAETLGTRAMSPYDVLVLPRLPVGCPEVTIIIRQSSGVFTPANDGQAPTSNDELLEAAEEVRRKLEGEAL